MQCAEYARLRMQHAAHVACSDMQQSRRLHAAPPRPIIEWECRHLSGACTSTPRPCTPQERANKCPPMHPPGLRPPLQPRSTCNGSREAASNASARFGYLAEYSRMARARVSCRVLTYGKGSGILQSTRVWARARVSCRVLAHGLALKLMTQDEGLRVVCIVSAGEPTPGADRQGRAPVPEQMWAGASPSPGADVGRGEPQSQSRCGQG
jgi:hypothetical protein